MTINCAKPRQRTFTAFRDVAQVVQWLKRGANSKRVINVQRKYGRIIINHWEG